MPGSTTFTHTSETIPYFYKEWNARGAMMESSVTWGNMGPAMYLMRKLFWDVDAEAEAIYSGYFRDAFGAGTEEMRALFDIWEERSAAQLSDTNIAAWLEQMNKAAKATENESPAVKRRVEDIMAYLHFVVLHHKAKQIILSKDLPRIKEARREYLIFNWRVRERQIIHTWGVIYNNMRLLDGVFKKPEHATGAWRWQTNKPGYEEYWEWQFNNTGAGKTFWTKNPDDYTAEEICDLFRKDLAEYSSKAARYGKYSKKLVPLIKGPAESFTGNGLLGAVSQTSTWHLHIDKNTNLRITFVTGKHGAEHSEPGNIYAAKLTDSRGKVLYEKKPRRYEDKVGKINEIKAEFSPGQYRLELNHSWYTGCRPTFDPPVKHVHEQSMTCSSSNVYMQTGFFYVPKGTKEVRFNLPDDQSFLTIKAPSWAKQKTYNRFNEYHGCFSNGVLAVPVGADDGKVWEFKHCTTGRYHFLNIPPCVATVKQNLLVPKEVLEKDGRLEASNQ